MAALTTLDGLANGTDIALQKFNGLDRWQIEDDVLVSPVGVRLEKFFFSGYLSEGRLFLHDFAPPQVGTWFSGHSDRHLLVLNVDGARCDCAQFRFGKFQDWADVPDIVTSYARVDPPEWLGTGSEAFLQMATVAWDQRQQARRYRRAADNASSMLRHVLRAQEYLNMAIRAGE